MKKLLYILFVVTLATSTFSSCTEEEIKPVDDCKGCIPAGGSPIKE
ncbi:MAG: hypothetical protein MUF39_10075 [Cyclobacteriaceae bacterium]|jgi:hypothetical protein|nr:hypothetical protein [Cyclobacteriaceae bacterium]